MDTERKKKNRIAIIVAMTVLVGSLIYLAVTVSGGFNGFGWFLAVANIVTGPWCLIAYLREVRKGIFKDVDREAEAEEEAGPESGV
jgi:uncharacterized membrane protein YhdT